MHARHRNSVAFTVVVTILVALCAIPVALVTAFAGAPSTVVLATILAALPVGPLVACFLWLDRYEPEPRGLLAAGLVWGGVVATAGAVLIGGLGGLVVGVSDEASLAVVAPVTEEATKGAFLLMLLWWRRHELDGILDGIVYAGMVGIGFAFVENILYLAAAYDGVDGLGPGGTAEITTVFVLRCLVSPFAHPFFTAFIGIGVGIAVGSRSSVTRFVAPLVGYLLAVLAHGLWNGSTLWAEGMGFLAVYLLVMFPVFVSMIGFAIWQRRSERRMLTVSLGDAAARGLFPTGDIGYIVDLGARRASRRYAAHHGGRAGRDAMMEYQQAAVELAFLHYRYLRGTAPADFASRGQEHLARLQQLRPHIAFPGQVVHAR